MPNVKAYAKEDNVHKLAKLFQSREKRIEEVYEAKDQLAIVEDDMRLHIASDPDLGRKFLKVDYNAIRRAMSTDVVVGDGKAFHSKLYK